MMGLGKILIFSGFVFIALGLIIVFGGRIPGLGRLPGDILIKKENITFYFPLTTSLILSAILSLLWMAFRQK